MRIREMCGCGASVEVDGDNSGWDQRFGKDVVETWRSNHKHVLCRPGSTESDERDGSGVIVPERDPRSTTDAWLESAGPFGFNRRSEDVIA